MISLFRKHITPQLTVTLGLWACLFATAASSQAQVATRTQVSAQNSDGVLSFTAKVADVAGAPVSEGSVSFETAKGSLGSVFVQDGVATLNVHNAPQWATTVTAVYHGDAAFAASTASTAATPDATSGVPGFTVTASPSSLSVSPGQYGTINLTVASQNGFAEAVNLSCSGLPGGATCNFNPVVVTPSANGSSISALQITTTAASGISADQAASLGRSGSIYAVLIPDFLALAGVGAIRRKNWGALRVLGITLLMTAGVLGLSGCNPRYRYLHYQPSPNTGTAAGNYTVIVAAYSTNGTAITYATSSDTSCSGAVCLALTVQ
jgi:Bacterial Ig-like domain (group 3)